MSKPRCVQHPTFNVLDGAWWCQACVDAGRIVEVRAGERGAAHAEEATRRREQGEAMTTRWVTMREDLLIDGEPVGHIRMQAADLWGWDTYGQRPRPWGDAPTRAAARRALLAAVKWKGKR